MHNIISSRPFMLLAILALVFIPVASAQLSPISFGFPVMTQSASNTAFSMANCTAFDLQQANFAPMGTDGTGFPTVSQSSVVGQANTAMQFSQNTVYSDYTYPEVDTGLGFAGFNTISGFGSLL